MTRDLDRWSGDTNGPEELRELLRSARTDVPSAHQLSGLEGKLAGLLDAPVPPAATPVPKPTGFGTPGLAKLAALVAIGGLVGTGVYLGTRSSPEAKSPIPAQTAKQLPAERAPAAPPSAAESEAAQTEPSATAEASSEPSPHAAKAGAKPSEAALLNQAQHALKTDPRRALALTRRHKQLYPQGSLSQEREVIAIEALSRLDKNSSAHERAEEFSEKYPESAHQKKVDTSLKK